MRKTIQSALLRLAVAAALCALPVFAQHEAQQPAAAQTPGTQPAAQHSEAAAPAGGHGTAEHGAAEHGKSGGHAASPYTEIWKWANFLILAGVLGYFIGKNAGPFFASRTKEIRKAMVEAGEMRAEAEAKAADVERRIANLGVEIETLRREARDEEAAEEERVRQSITAEIAKIRHHAETEIAAAGKAARTELQRYSAGLAIELAGKKLEGRMSPATQDALLRDFVEDLKQPSA